eukprot:9495996-Pyramimonas_sp.AAC.1
MPGRCRRRVKQSGKPQRAPRATSPPPGACSSRWPDAAETRANGAGAEARGGGRATIAMAS